MGYLTIRPEQANVFFRLMEERYMRKPTLITTNRPTQDWAKFLEDVPATTAILDRFLSHVEIVPMRGKSYRLKNPSAATERK